jgi:hypothetical protein
MFDFSTRFRVPPSTIALVITIEMKYKCNILREEI